MFILRHKGKNSYIFIHNDKNGGKNILISRIRFDFYPIKTFKLYFSKIKCEMF